MSLLDSSRGAGCRRPSHQVPCLFGPHPCNCVLLVAKVFATQFSARRYCAPVATAPISTIHALAPVPRPAPGQAAFAALGSLVISCPVSRVRQPFGVGRLQFVCGHGGRHGAGRNQPAQQRTPVGGDQQRAPVGGAVGVAPGGILPGQSAPLRVVQLRQRVAGCCG